MISGIGGLGHLAVQYAKAMGRYVIAVDVVDEKLRMAQEMGADAVINARETDPVSEAQNAAGGANGIEHTKTKARTPQTNGICERFHKTVLQEFYQVTFRKKLYASLDELQVDLDEWLTYYNTERTHQGKMCCGRTPMDTLEDGKRIWKEKFIA